MAGTHQASGKLHPRLSALFRENPRPNNPAPLRTDMMPEFRWSDATVADAHILLSPTCRGDIMVMAETLYYSAEMVRALPDDGKRYETVHGELLVTPSPRAWHQVIVRRILVQLDRYLQCKGVGESFSSPADISWGPDILVQPDLFVADLDEARTLEWEEMKTLLLAIEVLSPSTARYDRFTKRRLYQEVGIPVYWIVDPDEKVVEVWTPERQFPVFERETVTWLPDGAKENFVLDLGELFKPI